MLSGKLLEKIQTRGKDGVVAWITLKSIGLLKRKAAVDRNQYPQEFCGKLLIAINAPKNFAGSR